MRLPWVYKSQGQWAKRTRILFPKSVRRHPETWIDPTNPAADPEHHRWHRRLLLTGVVVVDGLVLPRHKWPEPDEVGYLCKGQKQSCRPRHRRGRSAKREKPKATH